MKPLSNHERGKLLTSISTYNEMIEHGEKPSRGFAKHIRKVKKRLRNCGINFPTVNEEQAGSLERPENYINKTVMNRFTQTEDFSNLYDQCPEKFKDKDSLEFQQALRLRQMPYKLDDIADKFSILTRLLIEEAFQKVHSHEGVCVLAWFIDEQPRLD